MPVCFLLALSGSVAAGPGLSLIQAHCVGEASRRRTPYRSVVMHSRSLRSVFAVGLSLFLVACRDEPTDPKAITRRSPASRSMTNQQFFTAWSWPDDGLGFRTTPIAVYVYAPGDYNSPLNPAFDRQWYTVVEPLGNHSNTDRFVNFALAHPGTLYLLGDEVSNASTDPNSPNPFHDDPQALANAYCAFLKPIWDRDHSATFSVDFSPAVVTREYVEAVNADRFAAGCGDVPISSWMPEWTINLMQHPWSDGLSGIKNEIDYWAAAADA